MSAEEIKTLLSVFTPSTMLWETLEAIFVKRENLAQRLVENIRDSAATEAKRHALVVGPRGMGKTHLVSLVYHRVRADRELDERLRIAWMREEERGAPTFLHLLRRILIVLADTYGDESLKDGLTGLARADAERVAERRLLEFLGDRTLLLIIENLDDLFNRLGEEGQRRLRAFLQTHNRCVLLATTPGLFGGVSLHTSPFYGFFNVEHLEELELDEAALLLEKIADWRGDSELKAFLPSETAHQRLRVVQALAGGHPRIWILFAGFITRDRIDALIPLFEKMLDELTPYYQSRMDMLPSQQALIVDFLAERRRAAPVKEIAEECFLDPRTVSVQLGELAKKGYVRSESVGRESHYELREPLMRLALEIKESRGRPIRLIVDFLRRWYSRSERRAYLESLPAGDLRARQHLIAALDLSEARHSEPDYAGSSSGFGECVRYIEEKQFDKALESIEDAIEKAGKSVVAEHWLDHGYCLAELKRYEAALESFDKALGIDLKYAYAWNNRGSALNNLQRYEAALESYDKALEIDPKYAYAWNNRGHALNNLQRYEAAIESLDKALEINPKYATAWNNRGHALNNLQRYEPALESLDKAVEIDPKYAYAWNNRGNTLDSLQRYEAALESYDKALEIDPNHVYAWNNRGNTLSNLQRYEAALESLDRAVEIDPKYAYALFNRLELFLLWKRWSEFLTELEKAFQNAEFTDDRRGDTAAFCRLILADVAALEQWPERIGTLVGIYEKNGALPQLGQGVTASIPELFAPVVAEFTVERWNAAWQTAGKGRADLEIPLRLLDAAARWRKQPDRRVLLSLPAEERQVLEELLPDGKTADSRS